jgi:hypothetical protein
MERKIWIRNAEIVSLLPATAFLAPMAGFTALGMIFALVQEASAGSFNFTAFLVMFGVLVSFLGAPVALASVWAAMAVPPDALARHRVLRIGLLGGILVGIGDAIYWLWTIGHQRGVHESTSGLSSWMVWLLMLAGPIFAGVHNVLRLARISGAK